MDEFDSIERGFDTPEGREDGINSEHLSGGEEGFLMGFEEEPEESEN